MALPDFLLIGAPKAGTTALHVALARHPQLFLSRVKEPKFFLTDGPPPQGVGPGDARTYAAHVWRQEDYEALFDDAPAGALRGESTTLYLHDPAAHRRIRALIPDVRIVAVLRDPVDRAHSNYTHLRSAGLEPEADFVRACDLEQDRAGRGWAPFWRYLELGRYGEQLRSLFEVFPREQVLLLRYRELREEPDATLDKVCAFLGVETGVLHEIPAENVTAAVSDSLPNQLLQRLLQHTSLFGHRLPAPLTQAMSAGAAKLLQREQRQRTPLTAEERTHLIPRFDDDITLLEEVTGESFDYWRDPGNSHNRRALPVTRRFGTAFSSIDNPL